MSMCLHLDSHRINENPRVIRGSLPHDALRVAVQPPLERNERVSLAILRNVRVNNKNRTNEPTLK